MQRDDSAADDEPWTTLEELVIALEEDDQEEEVDEALERLTLALVENVSPRELLLAAQSTLLNAESYLSLWSLVYITRSCMPLR